MFMRLDFSSKFTSPTSTLGPVATLAAEGTEKSRRVFSAMSSVDGAWEAGSLVDCKIGGGTTRGRTLLTSFSGIFNEICRQGETRHTLPCFHPIRRKQKDKHISLYKQ